MEQSAEKWMAEFQASDGRGITPCRQILLIGDLHEATHPVSIGDADKAPFIYKCENPWCGITVARHLTNLEVLGTCHVCGTGLMRRVRVGSKP